MTQGMPSPAAHEDSTCRLATTAAAQSFGLLAISLFVAPHWHLSLISTGLTLAAIARAALGPAAGFLSAAGGGEFAHPIE